MSENVIRLLKDCELFVREILEDENLSQHARETRDVLLNNFRVVHVSNPLEFPLLSDSRQEDFSDDNQSRSGPSDDASVASDYQDEGGPDFFGDIPPVAAQELGNILKQGHLEKRRRDHSFFGSEWQKRWCLLNNTVFYYFGNEKDKQQKGSFYINGYNVALVTNLRKDSKKNACFELSAPGQRTYQFTASNAQEAREWVDQISFVLRDLSSSSIPCDDFEDEEEVEEEEEAYDDIDRVNAPPLPRAGTGQVSHASRGEWRSVQGGQETWEADEEDDDIYEVLPEDDFSDAVESGEKSSNPAWSSDYANYYQGLWDCEADEPDELSFKRGDLIYIISKEYNIHGWWIGGLNGTVGIVPKDFLHPAYIL
ncbi:src kinase-associated phosphoprotein 1 [Genypterus blacodes]|uniref:src kinase-associated phosphoprotein 1 n=1 Tax=Genypterus blacodes TaxID=154954 RepID=UPI003F7618E6